MLPGPTNVLLPVTLTAYDLGSLSHIRGPSCSSLLQPHLWSHPTTRTAATQTYLLLRPASKPWSSESLLPGKPALDSHLWDEAVSSTFWVLLSHLLPSIPRQSWHSHCWVFPWRESPQLYATHSLPVAVLSPSHTASQTTPTTLGHGCSITPISQVKKQRHTWRGCYSLSKIKQVGKSWGRTQAQAQDHRTRPPLLD